MMLVNEADVIEERVEGILEQMDRRLNHLESDLSDLRSHIDRRISEVIGRIWWILGIQITMWITITLAILFK